MSIGYRNQVGSVIRTIHYVQIPNPDGRCITGDIVAQWFSNVPKEAVLKDISSAKDENGEVFSIELVFVQEDVWR